jgi:hypothetical protein
MDAEHTRARFQQRADGSGRSSPQRPLSRDPVASPELASPQPIPFRDLVASSDPMSNFTRRMLSRDLVASPAQSESLPQQGLTASSVGARTTFTEGNIHATHNIATSGRRTGTQDSGQSSVGFRPSDSDSIVLPHSYRPAKRRTVGGGRELVDRTPVSLGAGSHLRGEETNSVPADVGISLGPTSSSQREQLQQRPALPQRSPLRSKHLLASLPSPPPSQNPSPCKVGPAPLPRANVAHTPLCMSSVPLHDVFCSVAHAGECTSASALRSATPMSDPYSVAPDFSSSVFSEESMPSSLVRERAGSGDSDAACSSWSMGFTVNTRSQSQDSQLPMEEDMNARIAKTNEIGNALRMHLALSEYAATNTEDNHSVATEDIVDEYDEGKLNSDCEMDPVGSGKSSFACRGQFSGGTNSGYGDAWWHMTGFPLTEAFSGNVAVAPTAMEPISKTYVTADEDGDADSTTIKVQKQGERSSAYLEIA